MTDTTPTDAPDFTGHRPTSAEIVEQAIAGLKADLAEIVTTPPTDDEREGLARAIALELDIDPDDGRAHEAMARTVRPLATAALAYLAPIRAREIEAAKARVVQYARKLAQLNHRWATENEELQREHIALSSAYSNIADTFERGIYTDGDEG